MAIRTLYAKNSHPMAALPTNKARSIIGLTQTCEPAQQAATLASNIAPDINLLRKADRGWREGHGAKWFTRNYTATIPSRWAAQTLGHNIFVGLAAHLHDATKRLPPYSSSSSRKALQVAALRPTIAKPRRTLPSAYFYAMDPATKPA